MASLMSRNASKHFLLVLGVNCTARLTGKAKFTGGSDLVSQATPFTVSCETRAWYRQASQDVKQMLWSLPLKLSSHSLMAQRY